MRPQAARLLSRPKRRRSASSIRMYSPAVRSQAARCSISWGRCGGTLAPSGERHDCGRGGQLSVCRPRARLHKCMKMHNATQQYWPFGDLVPLSYGVIYADPPWLYKMRSAKGEAKSPRAHYRCMTLAEIMALPVAQLAAGDCWLWLWGVWPLIDQACATRKSWGFRPCTGGSWVKRTRHGKAALGTGYVLRSACEPFLIGRLNQPRLGSRSVRNLIETGEDIWGEEETLVDGLRREHSRKPEEAYDMIERLFPAARKCELFARSERPGWDSWGDEIGLLEAAA